MSRAGWPQDVESAVLIASKRRCALCFGLFGTTLVKDGQLAHVDRNAANSTFDNAAYLCLKHHGRYDSRSRQAKGLTPDELRHHRQKLYEQLANPLFWLDAPLRNRPKKGRGASLAKFDRRVPMYRATMAFLVAILKLHNIEMKDIWTFLAATDEALFLFDDSIAEYLALLYKEALRLRTVGLVIEAPERRTPELTQEHTDLALWFTEQFAEVRSRFAPFLRVR